LAILPFKPSIHAFVPGTPMRWWPVLYSDDLLLTPHELDEAGLRPTDEELWSVPRRGRTEAA
jgi:hypothetical protein